MKRGNLGISIGDGPPDSTDHMAIGGRGKPNSFIENNKSYASGSCLHRLHERLARTLGRPIDCVGGKVGLRVIIGRYLSYAGRSRLFAERQTSSLLTARPSGTLGKKSNCREPLV